MTARLLLIEDDLRLARSIAAYLQAQKFVVHHFSDGENLGTIINNLHFDLVLCDVMLPGTDGFEISSEIRQKFSGPIVFITALSDLDSQLKAFGLGADDYIVKPIQPELLLARINACLRRQQPQTEQQDSVQIDNLCVNRRDRKAELDGENLALSTCEFDLLWLLANHPQQALSREYLFSQTVGRSYDGLDRTIDGRISRLRKKLESQGQHCITIRTVWGRGYMLGHR